MTTADIREAVLDILSGIAPDEDLSDLKGDVPITWSCAAWTAPWRISSR
jgi:hypothetical protein